MEVLQLIFNTVASPILLITTITFLIAQCGKKKTMPDYDNQPKEPPYPRPQIPPQPGVVPTEEQYVYHHYPIKRRPEIKPPPEVILEMIAIREAAKNSETRKKWGEEYLKTAKPVPKRPGEPVLQLPLDDQQPKKPARRNASKQENSKGDGEKSKAEGTSEEKKE